MKHRGFTLVEAMIVVAILSLVAAIAIPAYQGYIRESRLGAMRMNLDTLRIAVEAFRLDRTNGNYGPTASYTTLAAISTQFGWKPEGDNAAYVYTVDVVSAATPTYWLRATGSGFYARCDKAAATFKCCGDKGAGTSACP
jgi:prepilin-type N-terminal cleavage/methylation domain-containing protein